MPDHYTGQRMRELSEAFDRTLPVRRSVVRREDVKAALQQAATTEDALAKHCSDVLSFVNDPYLSLEMRPAVEDQQRDLQILGLWRDPQPTEPRP